MYINKFLHKKIGFFYIDPPQPHQTFERFGYVIGGQGVINVTVYANPKPRFIWRVNQEEINEGQTDDSTRLQTSTASELVSFLFQKLILSLIFL